MPRSQRLETEKQEVLDHAFLRLVAVVATSVRCCSMQTDDDVGALELLLGVLQQGHECLLGAVAQLLSRHADIEPGAPQNGLPGAQVVVVGALVVSGGSVVDDGVSVEPQAEGGTVISRFVVRFIILGVQSLARRVRGIQRFPHSSALWEFPTGVGDIRSTVWAQHPA